MPDLFDNQRPKSGDKVIYTVPAKKFFGEVLEVIGEVAMVRLKEPKCVVQVTIDEIKVRGYKDV